RNADELRPHFIAAEPHLRIAMPARIDEFYVRRKFRVRNGTRPLKVEALGIFEAGSDAVLHEHIVCPIRLCRTGAVDQVQLPQGKLVGRAVLEGLHRASARQRGADEAEAHWLKLPGWELGRRISRPEAVAVARDDRKAGDFRVADKVVDLATLHPGAAIIVGTGIDETRRPRLGEQASGEVLRVDALVERALGIAPDLPRRGRALQLILEPRLLLCAEDRLRRRILLRVRDARLPEREFGGRIAAIEGAAPVEDLLEVFGEPAIIGCPIAQLIERIVAERVRSVVAVLIGDDEIEMLAVAECAVAYQAVDRDQVIRLIAKAVFVPLLDFDIGDRGRFEMFPGCSPRLLAARRNIFPPGLVGGNLNALSRPRDAPGLLNALPALP